MGKYKLLSKDWESIDKLGLSDEERSFLSDSTSRIEFLLRLEGFIDREEKKAMEDLKSAHSRFQELLVKYGVTEEQLMMKLIEKEQYEHCQTIVNTKQILEECDGNIDDYFNKKHGRKSE